jgi:hypothetical protein
MHSDVEGDCLAHAGGIALLVRSTITIEFALLATAGLQITVPAHGAADAVT